MIIRVKISRQDNPDYGKVLNLDLEEYLRDVVPSEVRAGYDHMEALKAQAVAARTYAMYRAHKNRYLSYDVTDSSGRDQAYKSRPRHPRSDQAVAETAGWVLAYNNTTIDCKYTNSNGGRVRSSLERWGTDLPYYRGFDDPYDTTTEVSGHGVGMSQTGARAMARAGKNYKEILAYYYPGTRLIKREELNRVSFDYEEHLSPHFKRKEFFDPANYTNVTNKRTKRPYTYSEAEQALNGKVLVEKKLLDLLEAMREDLRKTYPGATIVLTPHGGYRPTELNAAVGGAAGSQHRYGRAADFRVVYGGKKVNAADLAVYTEKFMADHGYKGGVGMYHADDDYIHVDVRGVNVHWYASYKSAGCPGQGGTPCVYKHGYKSAGVVLVQRKLKELGYDPGTADGIYGVKTLNAVRKFQESVGLKPDGIYGKATNAKLGALPW